MVYNAANSQQSNTYQYPTDKKVRKHFEVPTYFSESFKSSIIVTIIAQQGRSQWRRGLRRVSAAACLLELLVRIPPDAWMFFSCQCCVLSGRGLFVEMIARSEESYRLWCLVVCDLETSRTRRPSPALSHGAIEKKIAQDRQCTYNIETRSCYNGCCGKAVSVTYCNYM